MLYEPKKEAFMFSRVSFATTVLCYVIGTPLGVANAAEYEPMGIGGSFCDPAVIGLLREQYSVRESASISEAMKRSVCTSSVRGSNGAINIPIKNVTVGLSFGSTNSAQACVVTQNFYSEAFAREMSYSFLPTQAFELLASCNDGLFMTVDQPEPGTSVVRVGYRGFSKGEPIPGTVWKIEYDEDALECAGDVEVGTELYSMPKQLTCKHKKVDDQFQGSSLRIVLDDKVTDRGVYLGGVEEIAVDWKVVWVDAAKKHVGFKCATTGSDNLELAKIASFNCATEGSCVSESLNLGVCRAKLGEKVRVGHGTNEMVRSAWSFKTPLQATTLVCIKDGQEKSLVGNGIDFRKLNTYGLQGYCAFNW
jgi:hypothetical protein